jgi:hypothetical protein
MKPKTKAAKEICCCLLCKYSNLNAMGLVCGYGAVRESQKVDWRHSCGKFKSQKK